MIIVLDSRCEVASGFVSCFEREGVAAVAMSEQDYTSWIDAASQEDLSAVEAVLLGECADRCAIVRELRGKANLPLIALTESKSLSETLDLFSAGCDDVLRKPVHVREILVRASLLRQRIGQERGGNRVAGIQVFMDGRDPIVLGSILPLPRRERRILEYFVMSKGRRVSKTQIYNFVYGMFSEEVEECVIESHICKLRKKLRHRLGVDPIDSQRYLGYCLVDVFDDRTAMPVPEIAPRSRQGSQSNYTEQVLAGVVE